MKKTGVSIKWKMFGYLALLAGLLIAVLWLTQTVFLDDFYKYIKTQRIKAVSVTLSAHLDDPELQTLVTELALKEDVCILTLRDGYQTASADVLNDCMLHRMRPAAISCLQQWAYDNGGTYMERFTETPMGFQIAGDTFFTERLPARSEQTENMVYVTCAQRADGVWDTVILNTTISPVSATVGTLQIQLIFISAALLLLSLLLALLISRQIARPVTKLNNAAKELARGRYDTEFHTKGFREIAELGGTLRHAAHELSKVESLRRELIANVSHDLRTPLTMISGFAEAMRDIPGENTTENAQVIIDEAQRLTRLVSDLLDLSKLQNSAGAALYPVELTRLVRELTERLNALLSSGTEDAAPRVTFHAGADVAVLADETQLQQVVYNLLSNAVAYGGEHSSIEVWQTVKGDAVTVTVTDHGPGIPEQELPYIWDRYYKGAGGTSHADGSANHHRRASVGTGLGLSIVRGVLEQMGAQYGVASRPGEGASFWFSLRIEG